MPIPIPSGAAVELLRRTGLEPGQLGPNATPGRAIVDSFRQNLDSLRESARQAMPTQNQDVQKPTTTTSTDRTDPFKTQNNQIQAREIRPLANAQDGGPADRILSSFMNNRGDPPPGGIHLRLRAEETLSTLNPNLGQTLRVQAFERSVALGVQAARRGPSSLEETAHTLTQGGGGG